MTNPKKKMQEMKAKKQVKYDNVDLFELYFNKKINYKELLERAEMTRFEVNKKIGEMKHGQ